MNKLEKKFLKFTDKTGELDKIDTFLKRKCLKI
jgi:hypothetical protein